MDILELIGQNIKKYRLYNCYTQQQLADFLFVTKQSVSKWEVGKSMPTMDNIIYLCNILNCSPNSLLMDAIKYINPLFVSIANETKNVTKDTKLYSFSTFPQNNNNILNSVCNNHNEDFSTRSFDITTNSYSYSSSSFDTSSNSGSNSNLSSNYSSTNIENGKQHKQTNKLFNRNKKVKENNVKISNSIFEPSIPMSNRINDNDCSTISFSKKEDSFVEQISLEKIEKILLSNKFQEIKHMFFSFLRTISGKDLGNNNGLVCYSLNENQEQVFVYNTEKRKFDTSFNYKKNMIDSSNLLLIKNIDDKMKILKNEDIIIIDLNGEYRILLS